MLLDDLHPAQWSQRRLQAVADFAAELFTEDRREQPMRSDPQDDLHLVGAVHLGVESRGRGQGKKKGKRQNEQSGRHGLSAPPPRCRTVVVMLGRLDGKIA
jgi:hypothetical protein